MAPKIGTQGKMITAFGETKNIQGWSNDSRCRISRYSLLERLNKGWEPERAITTPPTKSNGRIEKTRVENGTKFNRLTLKEQWIEETNDQKVTMGRFECECGNIVDRVIAKVKNMPIRSCGCLRNEKSRERAKTLSLSHGLTDHPLYRVYHSMINRCYNSKLDSYANYGGRGIEVCSEWREKFDNFYLWSINNGWKKGLTIERKDVNGNYCAENCKIATRKEQGNNKTNNHRLSAFGEVKTIAEWVDDERCAVNYMHLFERVTKLGWNAEKAISTPTRDIDRSNPSKYVGVSFISSSKKWKAYVTVNQKRHCIGHYDTEEEAARARDSYVKKHGLTHLKINIC